MHPINIESIRNYLQNEDDYMIGISSYAFHDLPLSQALEKIEWMSECAEICSEGMHDLFRDAQMPLSYDLKYSVHAPTTDLNIGSIRSRSAERVWN